VKDKRVTIVKRVGQGREMIAFTDPGYACDFIVAREAEGDEWMVSAIHAFFADSVESAMRVFDLKEECK
jgi:hypothetical protein